MNEEDRREILKLLGSGAISGGVVGTAGSLLSGAKTASGAFKAGAIGAGLGSSLAGLSGAIGVGLFGRPKDDDPSGYTKRMGMGGAIAGGLAGAGAGALLKLPGMRKYVASKLGGGLVSRGVASLKGGAPAAAALGTGGALVGGYQSGDEGMQMDFLRNLSAKEKEKLFLRQYEGEFQ